MKAKLNLSSFRLLNFKAVQFHKKKFLSFYFVNDKDKKIKTDQIKQLNLITESHQEKIPMRIGTGYDVHRLVSGRKLVLGGITIPFEKGLLGHSDADVLIHAICDALLGAAGLGDIGLHFPDTDPQFKDIYSMKLLAQTCEMLRDKGFSIINIDSTIFAEKPKLSPYRKEMQENIARTLEIASDCVNIKATTTEGLGMIGKGEGIGAMSVALIEKTNEIH